MGITAATCHTNASLGGGGSAKVVDVAGGLYHSLAVTGMCQSQPQAATLTHGFFPPCLCHQWLCIPAMPPWHWCGQCCPLLGWHWMDCQCPLPVPYILVQFFPMPHPVCAHPTRWWHAMPSHAMHIALLWCGCLMPRVAWDAIAGCTSLSQCREWDSVCIWVQQQWTMLHTL